MDGRFPDAWERAMGRAAAQHLHAIKVNDRTYVVRSTSNRGTHHVVRLDAAGRIYDCGDCPGWAGRNRPCKHAGAVARRILRETRTATPATLGTRLIDETTVETPRRSRLFRSEVGA